MKIGIAGPADLTRLAPRLDKDCHDLPPGLGASGISTLVLALLDLGHHVSLYTLDMSVDAIRRFSGERLTVLVGPFRPRHRMRDLMAVERRAVRDMILTDQPDIVSAHWLYEYALGALASGRPTMATAHDWAPAILRATPDAYRAARLLLFGFALLRIRRLVAVSPSIAKRLGQVTFRACPVIPLGLPEQAFAAAPRRYPAGPPRLLAANNGFGGVKNLKTLLRAFPTIRAAYPTAELTLLGHDHATGGPAHRWAKASGLDAGIRFVGPVPPDEVSRLMSRASLFIHPSVEESLGMVLVEAMAAATPVIALRKAGGPCWVLDQGRAGVLLDGHSADDIASAAIALLNAPARWEGLSAAGWEWCRRNFSAPAIADAYVALCRELSAERRYSAT